MTPPPPDSHIKQFQEVSKPALLHSFAGFLLSQKVSLSTLLYRHLFRYIRR